MTEGCAEYYDTDDLESLRYARMPRWILHSDAEDSKTEKARGPIEEVLESCMIELMPCVVRNFFTPADDRS